MSKILSGSIDLTKLQHQKVKTAKGNTALLIPIDLNKLIVGEKGVYMNISIFINDEVNQYDQIGSIKQNASAPKGKKWADLSDDEKEKIKNLPYLGNVSEQGTSQGSAMDEAESFDSGTNDLPF